MIPMIQNAFVARFVFTLSMACALAGCISTRDVVLKNQIRTYDRAIEASNATLATFQEGGVGPYQVKLFLRTSSVNQALSVLDGFKLPAPGISNATITLNQARLSRFGSFPALDFSAEAQRSSIKVKVALSATLIPTSVPGEMKLSVTSFAPDVSVLKFRATKVRFIRDLLSIELDKLTEKMPAMKLPLSQEFSIGAPANSREFRFQTSEKPSYLTVRVDVPSTQWNASVQNVRYYFIKDGVFIFGAVQ